MKYLRHPQRYSLLDKGVNHEDVANRDGKYQHCNDENPSSAQTIAGADACVDSSAKGEVFEMNWVVSESDED